MRLFSSLACFFGYSRLAFLAIVVPLMISLAVENFLADSASPGGVAYNLMLTSMRSTGSAYAETKLQPAFIVLDSFILHTETPPGAWSASWEIQ
jgi:hypothetical protein